MLFSPSLFGRVQWARAILFVSLSTLASVFAPFSAAGQSVAVTLTGRVVDRATGAPVSGAILSLTDRGREVYESIVRHRLHHLANVLSSWSAEDRGVLTGLVDRLATDLGDTDLPQINTSSLESNSR